MNSSSSSVETAAPNAFRLLWAGFMAILAAGVGFAIRGGILDNWGAEFGFSGGQLGLIGSAGLTGFCFGIIIGGVVVDKIGYGKLVFAAFLFHIASALIAFCATPGTEQTTAFNYLFIGTFIFALANGTLEAVANPLVATLFPHNRTHYLNILHASWPLGLVLGSVTGWILDDKFQWDWKMQLGLYLIPTLAYGLMFFGQSYPRSEASAKGLSLGEMFKDVGILGALVIALLLVVFVKDNLGGELLAGLTNSEFFRGTTWFYLSIAIGAAIWIGFSALSKWSLGSILLFVLFIAHAMVGAVELGTDGWIQNITGNILTSEQGKILFAFTSLTMFLLRFCADFIEKRIGLSPIAILLVCAILACVALNFVSGITSFGGALLALTVYGIGKTFFWPTMLAVASDRFPRTGAVAISIMGGIGMLSGGLIGAVGLGYAKDRFAAAELRRTDAQTFELYKADKATKFLFLESQVGLDGRKLGEINAKNREDLSPEEKQVLDASILGDRQTLRADSLIPGAMAVIYLGLLLYFKSIGGYKPVRIEG
jgi:MFS family permease